MLRGICGGVSVVSGLVLLGCLWVTVFYFDGFVNKAINEGMAVFNGSEMWDKFMHPPKDLNPYLQVYFFNVSNKEEFLRGEKPVVKEVGPYSYRQEWKKVNISAFENGTVASALQKTYFFDPAASVGKESDMVTVLNVPFVTAVWQVRYTPRFIQLIFSSMLEALGETPFATHNVSSLMWGYEDPLLKMARDILPPHQRSPSDSFGFFLNKNGTADTLLNQYGGTAENMTNYLEIDLVDRQSHMGLWRTDECDRVHGSDGTGWTPGVTRNQTLYLFNKAICRSLPLTFLKDTEKYGIKGYRFSPPANVFADVEENPANECYCLGGPPCLGGGVFNASACLSGSPAVISWPHFFGAAQSYVDAVEGMMPDEEKHRFTVDIAPRTGTPVQVQGRVQINMALTNVSEIKPADGLRPMVFPVIWFQDGVPKMPDNIIADLQMANNLPEVVKLTAITLCGAFGAVLLVGGAALLAAICSYRAAKRGTSSRGHVNPALEHPEKD